jgi:uncharacterized protein (TIGR02145 family)
VATLRSMTEVVRACAAASFMMLACMGASCSTGITTIEATSAIRSAKRMADGNQWTIENLNVATDQSYCFEDIETNCRRYGRLYTWEAGLRACRSLGGGWRLPTEEEWKTLAKHYGGLYGEPGDENVSLLSGGSAGFNAIRAGNRSESGAYERLDAHGFYWTATETGPAHAWFYNFGRAGPHPNHHEDGEKQSAVSVRCIRT